MKNKKKTIAILSIVILLAIVIAVAAVFWFFAGKKDKKKTQIIVIRKENDTSDIVTSEDDSSESIFEDVSSDDTKEESFDEFVSDNDSKEDLTDNNSSRPRRELYQKVEKERYVETFLPEYTVNSVKWDGPQGNVIIFPEGNDELKEAALKLKTYFYEQYKIELWVLSDSTTEQTKEILIGKTNRNIGNFGAEGEFAVELIGDKLVFEGSHYVSVNKAVDAFVSLKTKNGFVNALEGKFDFQSEVKDGYKYVWGDEFDGSALDTSKWGLDTSMTGTPTMKLDSENCIKVEDGRMKLYSLHYFDQTDPNVEYAVPFCVSTRYTMSFKYGYLEMRARVPFEVGAWPSLWTGSNNSLGPHTEGLDYNVEVDIFEVFASKNVLVPNTHKWYHNGEHTQGGIQTDGNEKKSFVFENSETLSNEYHTYGFEWTPTTMTMYVDGVAYTTIDITKSYDENEDMRGFQDPLMLKINNHLFVADSPFKAYSGCTVDGAELPFEYFIDYIRLYQKSDNSALYLGE